VKPPGMLDGALVGLLVTAPLIAISGLAYQLAGLAFVPFDLFGFVRNVAPGRLLIASIELMKNAIEMLHLGRVDTTAKLAEQSMAVLQVAAIGLVVAALYFHVMHGRTSRLAGWFLGLIVGIILAALAGTVPTSAATGSPVLNAAWIVASFVVWGWAVNWCHTRLVEAGGVVPAPATAPR
jgi:hypothetical protein